MDNLTVLKVREYESKLIEKSLTKAAEVLSGILNTNIEVDEIVVGSPKMVNGQPVFYEGKLSEINILRTKLLGELSGICYLIQPTEEVRRIQEACMPLVDTENFIDAINMKEGFLMEIDNIISGAVISIFSNELDVAVHGDVPSLHRMMLPAVNEYLYGETLRFDHVINFKAIFKGTEIEIAPEFIWVLDSSFLKQISKVLDKKINHLNLI